jgi:aspartyl protease family protein
MNLQLATIFLALVLTSATAQAAPSIEIEGLMPPNAAVLTVDGERKLVKVGQTFKGVSLISVYSKTATLEVDGQQTVLGISRRVGANYEAPAAQQVSITRNRNLQYMTNALINGRQTQVMVDTGANIVAMNEAQAKQLGVKTDSAERVMVETASDKIGAWKVKLDSIDVGGIRINHVEATVVEGGFPSVILLGMTYLKHVNIEENQGVMTLSRGR